MPLVYTTEREFMKITLGIFGRNGKPHPGQSSRNDVQNPAAELGWWVIQGPCLLPMPLPGQKLRLAIVVTPRAGGLCCHLSWVHLAFSSQVAHFQIEVPHAMYLTEELRPHCSLAVREAAFHQCTGQPGSVNNVYLGVGIHAVCLKNFLSLN